MRGAFGVLIGIILIAVGLGGLGVALDQMMTHADPGAAIKAVGGLGVFVAVCVVSLILAR